MNKQSFWEICFCHFFVTVKEKLLLIKLKIILRKKRKLMPVPYDLLLRNVVQKFNEFNA